MMNKNRMNRNNMISNEKFLWFLEKLNDILFLIIIANRIYYTQKINWTAY